MKKHSFVICAYKESPYLEKCILSLLRQRGRENCDVVMCTSTPCDYIEKMAEKYGIPLMINPTSGGIQSDWNFAYNACDSQYITLVHQDDVYSRNYSRHLLAAASKYNDIAIFYSGYRALVTSADSERVSYDLNCRLRTLLSFPMRFPALQDKEGWKRMVLRFGNSICCSSVTYNKAVLGERDIFHSTLCYSLDWDMFLDLSARGGRFFYDKSVLTYFRIHERSTSMLCIENEVREREDYIMFYKMWPKPIADFLMLFYKRAYSNYKRLKKEKTQ